MKKSRFTETQIVTILNEADAGITVQADNVSYLSHFREAASRGGT